MFKLPKYTNLITKQIVCPQSTAIRKEKHTSAFNMLSRNKPFKSGSNSVQYALQFTIRTLTS